MGHARSDTNSSCLQQLCSGDNLLHCIRSMSALPPTDRRPVIFFKPSQHDQHSCGLFYGTCLPLCGSVYPIVATAGFVAIGCHGGLLWFVGGLSFPPGLQATENACWNVKCFQQKPIGPLPALPTENAKSPRREALRSSAGADAIHPPQPSLFRGLLHGIGCPTPCKFIILPDKTIPQWIF